MSDNLHSVSLFVLFITQAAVLCQHIKFEATAKRFSTDRGRTTSVLNDFKNKSHWQRNFPS